MQKLQAAENRQFWITTVKELLRSVQIIKELWRRVSHGDCPTTQKVETIKKVPLSTLENENSIILWLTTDSLKEKLPSPQKLGRAACKL